jgi:hypothetical protein
MFNTMIITLLAFTLLYFYLLKARIRLERTRDDYGETRALWEELNNR